MFSLRIPQAKAPQLIAALHLAYRGQTSRPEIKLEPSNAGIIAHFRHANQDEVLTLLQEHHIPHSPV